MAVAPIGPGFDGPRLYYDFMIAFLLRPQAGAIIGFPQNVN
jgi:hypothetical protein